MHLFAPIWDLIWKNPLIVFVNLLIFSFRVKVHSMTKRVSETGRPVEVQVQSVSLEHNEINCICCVNRMDDKDVFLVS